ncbi:glutaredoxin family protein [Haloechinothrix alba]|uniref:glutaredoxin family protein n=1 Tax=Haloechinothrix alba TaxID=664784 RepID=UPI000B78DB44|nr:glutaredoxin family protein [Haloechinothrix alba]
MGHVTVLSRQSCTLCAEGERAVERICTELGASWSVTDVDSDPELRAEYGDRVPVFLVDGQEHGYWAVEEDRLRGALRG